MINIDKLPVDVEKLILENKIAELERENFMLRDQLNMMPREMPLASNIDTSVSAKLPEFRLCSRSAIMECNLNYLTQGVDFFTKVEVDRGQEGLAYRIAAFNECNIKEDNVPRIIQIMMGDMLVKVADDFNQPKQQGE